MTSQVEAALSCTRIEISGGSRDWLLGGFGRSRIWLLLLGKTRNLYLRDFERDTAKSSQKFPLPTDMKQLRPG